MGEEYTPFQRRNPEEYLAEIQRKNAGKLKLYVGAAPGVGKTYKMLQDAKDLQNEGIDIVIGLIEAHGRADTEGQIKGLEKVPLKEIIYKGKTFYELNVEAIIKRAPKVVLVDELAHTNAPTSKNKKRYMDVEELLEAGIDVIAAMNIQHLEGVHDIVHQITGIAVKERVPNTVLQKAIETQLVDVTPEVLQKRMKEGKIYKKEKIEQSLRHFFTLTNLAALRELALREVADDVDEKILCEENEKFIGVKERIIVCVQYNGTAEKLIRRGGRMAKRLNAELYVLNIGIGNDVADSQKDSIRQNWALLTKQFDGIFMVEPSKGKKVADVIVGISLNKKVTQIVLGQSARTRWEEIKKGSIVNTIMRKTKNIDIHIVAENR